MNEFVGRAKSDPVLNQINVADDRAIFC